jgi:hypothetical protein
MKLEGVYMKKAYIKFVFLALALSMSVACGKRVDEPAPVADGRTGGNGLVNANGVGIVNLVGNGDQTSFTNMVKAFLAPTIKPEEVGTVNPSNGVRFGGRIPILANGQIDPNSQIQFEVVDSFANTLNPQTNQNYGSIFVNMKGGVSGDSKAINGTAVITFSDEYGTVRIEGTYANAGGNFTGTIKFSNASANYNGINSGTLGSFTVPTCSFFVCAN